VAAGQSCGEVKHAFQNFKVSVTGRYAVSLPIFLLLVPFGVLVSNERERLLNPGSYYLDSLLIVVAGFFASFLYIFLAQATLLKSRKRELQPLWKCVFVWYSTGFVQGVAASLYAHYAFRYQFDLAQRTGMTTFYIGTGLALTAFYFGSIDRRRVEDQALQSLEMLLAVDKGEMVSSDAKARADALGVLENVIKPQIEKLQALISGLTTGDSKHASELTLASQELLKATEREAGAVARSRKLSKDQAKLKLKRISFLSGIFPHELSVRISIVLIAFGALTGQLPRNGWEGVLAGEIGAAIIGIVLFILYRVVKRNEGKGRRIFLISSYVLVFLTQALWTQFHSRVGFELRDPYHPLYSAVKTIYGVYVASIVSSLVVDTSTRLERTRSHSDQIREEIAYLTQEQEALEQHLYATRFGTLQGKISGVIMALQLIGATPQTPEFKAKRENLIKDAAALLNDALREIAELGKASAR